MIRPRLNCAEESETAARTSSRSTRSGRSDCHAGHAAAENSPSMTARVTASRGVSLPASARAARADADAAMTRLVAWMKRGRRQRSAASPPSGEPTMLGAHAATVSSPSQSASWVVSVR